VNVLSRRIGSVVAAAAVAFGLAAVAAPAASAAPAVTAPAAATAVALRGPWWCQPAHIHARNVDIAAAQDGADTPDHAGAITVIGQQ